MGRAAQHTPFVSAKASGRAHIPRHVRMRVMWTAVPRAYLPLKGGGRPPKAVGWGSLGEHVIPTRLASLGDLPLSGGGDASLCLRSLSPSEFAEMCASGEGSATRSSDR